MFTRGHMFLLLSCVLALSGSLFAQDGPVDPDAPAKEQDTTQDDTILQQDQAGTLESYGGTFEGLQHLDRIQFLSNIETLKTSPTLLPFHDSVKPLDLTAPQPLPLGRTDADPIFGSPFSPIMSPIRNIEAFLGENLGMNFGIYYTLLWQNVSNPLTNEPANIGTGRLDFNLVWNIFDEPETGHGLIGFLLRKGDQIGVKQDQSATTSSASLVGLDSLATRTNEATVNLLYYQQGLFEDRLVVSVGKIHPNQYIALNFWANDESRQFLAGPFDGIAPLGDSLGGYQLGVAMQLIPTDWLFINSVVTDALGYPETSFSTLGDGYYWTSVEAGFVLPIAEEATGGPTALSVIWSNQNLDDAPRTDPPKRKTSNAFAMLLQGHITTDMGYFAQWGIAEPGMSTVEQSFSCGFGVENPLGRGGDYFGAAFNWSKPSSQLVDELESFGAPGGLREQSMFEFVYRIQLTGSMQLSPDLQIVLDPGNLAQGPTRFIFGLRLRTDF